ncbi:hypothetical protein KM043_007420 [Ampulex compressa]|nr:hypothetical protein KM043_007420 [Ampulex compressa]
MSNSLVRKGLELLGYDNDPKQEKKKRKYTKYKGALDLIPTKHRIISKNDTTDLGSILGRSGKTTVYETRKRITARKDPTEENVRRLLTLSSSRIDPETADKLLNRAVKKRYIPKEEKPKETEKTVFTEEDFKKFEEEYVE